MKRTQSANLARFLVCAMLFAVGSAKAEERSSTLQTSLSSTTISGYVSSMVVSRTPEEFVMPTFDPQLADLLTTVRDEITVQDDRYSHLSERPIFDFEKPRSAKEIQVVPEPSSLAFLVTTAAVLTRAMVKRRRKNL